MLYLDLALNKYDLLEEEEKKQHKIIRKIKIFIRDKITKIFDYEIDGKTVLVLSKVNKNVLKKLSKIFMIDVTKTVCVSDELYLKEEFMDFLRENKINVLNGRWLFKYLSKELIEYILKNSQEKIYEQEISILANESSMFINGIIKELSEVVHNINVITNNLERFQKLKSEIYNENGMLLNVSNNYRKSASRSKIILNFDFSKEDLEKLNIIRKAVIINFSENLKIERKGFDGIICNFYALSFSYDRYYDFYKKLNHFNKSVLYESFVYRQTYYKNILNDLKIDNVKIESLEGIRGDIKQKEFKKICNL